MTDPTEPAIVDERLFNPDFVNPPPDDRAEEYVELYEGGPRVTRKFHDFLHAARHGRLPKLGPVPEIASEIRALAEEFAVIHLPEWRNGTGRKLADPTVTNIKQPIRIAEYLHKRGYRWHSELEEIRWVPTPGGLPGAFDTGIHITPDDRGRWPILDAEAFYDVSDITTERQQDGTWAAIHPRGLAFTAATKSEAYAGLVTRLREKIEEAK